MDTQITNRYRTWNTRTLQKAGAVENETKVLTDYKICLCAIQEARLPGDGQFDSAGYTLFYSCDDRGRKMLGTDVLFDNIVLCNMYTIRI